MTRELVVSRRLPHNSWMDDVSVFWFDLGVSSARPFAHDVLRTHVNHFIATSTTPSGWYAKLPGAAGVRRHGVFMPELFVYDKEG